MPGKTRTERKTKTTISNIHIERLFGRYDYDLDFSAFDQNKLSKMGIIYGDNGTGKTTILKLIFHLLSTADARGHRTFLAGVPLRSFTVTLTNGTEIGICRKQERLIGAYTLTFGRKSEQKMSADVTTDEDYSISDLPETAEEIIKQIHKLGLSIYFLMDDRLLDSDRFPIDRERDYDTERDFSRRKYGDLINISLLKSLERTMSWIHQRLIQESYRGEADAQQIYADILEKINKRGPTQIPDHKKERANLIAAITELDKRSGYFSGFGLISRINSKRFIENINKTGPKRIPYVAQVVSTFIDGQKARLDALNDLNNILHRFVTLLNGFLLHKYIDLNVRKGISIVTDMNTFLEPSKLSSGEKQLLLLFCNVLTSSDSASLFIIDEPEMSLNVKWQRNLVDALIDITKHSQCQFLLASHSIELISKYKKQVMRL